MLRRLLPALVVLSLAQQAWGQSIIEGNKPKEEDWSKGVSPYRVKVCKQRFDVNTPEFKKCLNAARTKKRTSSEKKDEGLMGGVLHNPFMNLLLFAIFVSAVGIFFKYVVGWGRGRSMWDTSDDPYDDYDDFDDFGPF